MAIFTARIAGLCSRKMSVSLSVCHMPVFCRNGSSNFCHCRVATPFLVFPYYMAVFWRGPHNGGVECKGYEKSRFLTIISLYLGNNTLRQSHSYYAVREAFEWHQFQWPLVNLSDLAKYSTTRSIARSLCGSWSFCCIPLVFDVRDKGPRVASIHWNFAVISDARKRDNFPRQNHWFV